MNRFLPLSIEPTCRQIPFIPPHLKPNPPQAYLFGKYAHYFTESFPRSAWKISWLEELHDELNISLVGGFIDDDAETYRRLNGSAKIFDRGFMSMSVFNSEVSKSFVMIGAGAPGQSPSPWDALCLGVPVSGLYWTVIPTASTVPRSFLLLDYAHVS